MNKRLWLIMGTIFVVAAAIGLYLLLVRTVPDSGGKAPNSTATPDPARLQTQEWVLVRMSVAGKDVKLPAEALTLTFGKDAKAGGFSGCNTYFGGYQTGPDGKLTFVSVSATPKACLINMEQEGQYLNSIKQVQRYQYTPSGLKLSNTASTIVLEFKAGK